MSRAAPLLALALVATPALAQAPIKAAPPPAPLGMRRVAINVSPAGQAVLKRYLGAPDPFVQPRLMQLRSIAQQMTALADASKLDLPRLQGLMRQQEGIQGALQHHGNDRTIEMLGALSEQDRLTFVRSLRAGAAAAKAPPAK